MARQINTAAERQSAAHHRPLSRPRRRTAVALFAAALAHISAWPADNTRQADLERASFYAPYAAMATEIYRRGDASDSWFGSVVSTEFPVFEVKRESVLPEVLDVHFRNPALWASIVGASTGTNVRRRRLNPQGFLDLELPLPSMERQRVLARAYQDVQAVKAKQSESKTAIDALLSAILDRAFAGAL